MNAYRHATQAARLVSRARLLLAAARETLADTAMPAAARSRSAAGLIATARALWSRVRLAVALGDVTLSHTYTRKMDGWRGLVTLTDDAAIIWTSPRAYAHRQSAQRAALRQRGAFVVACEDATLAGTLLA